MTMKDSIASTLVICFILLMALSGCVTPPPEATGPWEQLNPGLWQLSPNELTTPPPGM